jgi:hypothetical protein
MSAVARAIVKASARTLPVSMRDRYREQWLADVRDATEAGVSVGGIARGAVAFTMTAHHPTPQRPKLDQDGITGRQRLALGFSLASALLALSYYAATVGYGSVSENTTYDFVAFIETATLSLFGILAPIAAIAILAATPGTAPRVRWAVALFVLASLASVTSGVINDRSSAIENVYLTPGALAYLIGFVFVAVGCALVWRRTGQRSRAAPVIGSLVIWVVAALGLAYAVGAWAQRLPLVWGPRADPAYYDEWVSLKESFEQLVDSLFWIWAVVGVVLGVIVIVVGHYLSRRHAIALTVGVLGVELLGLSMALGFLELGQSQTVPHALIEQLRLAGQFTIAGVALVVVGGIRYERRALPRVSHRHDVEGSVELL